MEWFELDNASNLRAIRIFVMATRKQMLEYDRSKIIVKDGESEAIIYTYDMWLSSWARLVGKGHSTTIVYTLHLNFVPFRKLKIMVVWEREGKYGVEPPKVRIEPLYVVRISER